MTDTAQIPTLASWLAAWMARRREPVGLRWADVRLEQSEVRIRRSLSVVDGGVHLLPTNSARPRVLSIADSVVEVVAGHREEHERKRANASVWEQRWDLVFTDDTGGHVSPARTPTPPRASDGCSGPGPRPVRGPDRPCRAVRPGPGAVTGWRCRAGPGGARTHASCG